MFQKHEFNVKEKLQLVDRLTIFRTVKQKLTYTLTLGNWINWETKLKLNKVDIFGLTKVKVASIL